ncbi:hypothetical protein [Streptomyces sp. NPDC046870]|uniref:hypothetical protein n=1 Tax=Streptomyces sp. NPDC046870 TaxID=3155135 RepID=UPI00345207B3
MDFVFTVISADAGQVEGLLQWLRQDAGTPAWSSQAVPVRHSVDFRVSGDIDTAARFARSLVDWRDETARTVGTVFVTVDVSATTTFSVSLPHRATDRELRDRLSQLVGDAIRAAVTPGTVHLAQERIGAETPAPPVGHTSPGPVLDPDDDWARDTEGS